MKTYYTANIKLASILAGLGVPRRAQDPTTCHFDTRPGHEDRKYYNFWFDLTDEASEGLCKEIVAANEQARAGVGTVKLDIEHPFFYMHAALENREALMNEIRSERVVPMRIIEHGNRTLLISDRASERTKALMRGALNGDYSAKEDV